MNKKFLMAFFLLPCSALATSYNSTKAVEYAKNNVFTDYGSSTHDEHVNPFTDYTNYGGNCTNFVSQSILGGLVGTNKTYKAYNKRRNFASDRYIHGYQWFFVKNTTQSGYGKGRGAAWTEAESLKTYAQNNKSNYKGLHFKYITHDDLKNALNVDSVKVGDVIFADWTMDGVRDHSMIVTKIKPRNRGYSKIYVTYQNGIDDTTGEAYPLRKDYSLHTINKNTNYKAQFVVYRPIDYKH